MQHSRPCLRQSLMQLVRMQDYLDEEERQEREAKQRAEAEKEKEKACKAAAEKKAAEAAANEKAELEAAAKKAMAQEEGGDAEVDKSIEREKGEKGETQERGPLTETTVTSPILTPAKDSPKASLFDRFRTRVRTLTGGETVGLGEEEPESLTEGDEVTEKTSPVPLTIHRSESVPIGRHDNLLPEAR